MLRLLTPGNCLLSGISPLPQRVSVWAMEKCFWGILNGVTRRRGEENYALGSRSQGWQILFRTLFVIHFFFRDNTKRSAGYFYLSGDAWVHWFVVLSILVWFQFWSRAGIPQTRIAPTSWTPITRVRSMRLGPVSWSWTRWTRTSASSGEAVAGAPVRTACCYYFFYVELFVLGSQRRQIKPRRKLSLNLCFVNLAF